MTFDLPKTLPACVLAIALSLPGMALADGHGTADHADMVDHAAEAVEATADSMADTAEETAETVVEAMDEATSGNAMMSAPDVEPAMDPGAGLAPIATPEPDPIKVMMSDRILGDVNAPVTMVEYASMTCPHCASFHNNVLPTIKEQYIDTGKVRMILRDFPLDQYALQAAALTRCAPEDRYHKLVEVVFGKQQDWARSRNPTASLANLFKLGGGMTDQQIEACVTTEKLLDSLLKTSQKYGTEREIRSTPTIFIYSDANGANPTRIEGSLAVSRFTRAIDALLPSDAEAAE
ncbi:MAG: DsbA family protein [Alphaproteobacteria bacterium]